MVTFTQRAVVALESLESHQRNRIEKMVREVEQDDPPAAKWIVEGMMGKIMIYAKKVSQKQSLAIAYLRVDGGVEILDILVGKPRASV